MGGPTGAREIGPHRGGGGKREKAISQGRGGAGEEIVHAHLSLDSSLENRRQEEFNNRGAEVRRRVDRRSVGWLCRRGGRRLRVCWPAGAGGRDGGGSGYWRAGRTAVCGRTGRGARPERLWG